MQVINECRVNQGPMQSELTGLIVIPISAHTHVYFFFAIFHVQYVHTLALVFCRPEVWEMVEVNVLM